jgi:hypothetical protein
MRTIKIILASIFYLGTLNLFEQATEFNKQTKKYESLSESIKSFFIGGNISSAYSEDFGPQGNVGSINTTFGTFDINDPSTTSTFSFIFNPYVGIIKTDKVSVGISALFSLDRDVFEDGRTFGTSTNSEPFTESELAFGLGLFYRRDLFTKDRFTLFTQYASQYTREQNRVITESGTNDSSTTNDKINL